MHYMSWSENEVFFSFFLSVYILQFCYGMNSGYPAITTPQVPNNLLCSLYKDDVCMFLLSYNYRGSQALWISVIEESSLVSHHCNDIYFLLTFLGEHTWGAIKEICDIWDTDYNSDNWELEFLTIFVTWHLRLTVDSIRNSCHVLLTFLSSGCSRQGSRYPLTKQVQFWPVLCLKTSRNVSWV